MKNLVTTLSLLGLSLSLGLNAQNSSMKAKSQNNAQPAPSMTAPKSLYISNQDYLSGNSLAAYQNAFGDSLKGFDENYIKKILLADGISGGEIQGHIYHLKRNYINNKYGIGPKLNYISPNTGNSGSGTNPGGKLIGGNNSINVAPCVNEDFELTSPGVYTASNSVTGWTITNRVNNDGICNPTGWLPGSPAFAIVPTPILSWGSVGGVMGVIPNSPLGGTLVAQLNNQATNDYNCTRMTQTFPVTSANTLFQFAYAGYWQNGGAGHACCPTANSQPGLNLKMYDCLGNLLTCSNLSLNPGGGCQSTGVNFTVTPTGDSWCNWQTKYLDLTPYVGTCVTMEVICTDCSLGGHWGSTLFDAKCGGQLIGTGMGGNGGTIGGPVSFCAGSNQAQITAPVGYSTYQWFAPGTGSIAAPQGTMSTLVINNPLPGSVYTVQLVAASGCVFTSTNVIATSTVAIIGIGSGSTCAGGASGSATVVGNGSGTGYNYTWINALTSATVGTTAVVNNLGPGTYSVILTGLGAAGCGSAVSTVTVATAPPGIIPLLKPFCSGQAYLGTSGGSNFKWYNGLTPIPSPFGTNPTYTVTAPVNGSVYWLSYLSSQGCQDSVQYTLVQSAFGVMAVSNISWICPGGNNGTAQVNLVSSAGAPPGLTSYSVWSTGTTPAYSSSLFPTALTTYTFGGLSAGTYSVDVFDGSCRYGTSFNVTPYIYNYNVTPVTTTLCPGSSIAAAISFANPALLTQCTYSWSPSTNMFGANSPNIIVTPSIPQGPPVLLTYSVKVTPNVVNCPITKTITILAVNPKTPTITAIPNICDNSVPYQILVSPLGGTFVTGITGTNNPISSLGGILSPTFANNGINTVTYTVKEYTCPASTSASYQVSKYWTSALSSAAPPLCVTNPPFNLMNIVQNTVNGSWSGQIPSTVIGSTLFNPANLSTGNYLVSYKTLSTPNPTVCPSTTTLNIAVTKTITPVITQIPEFCTNAPLMTMNVNPAGGGWLPNTNGAVTNAGILNPTLVPVPGMIVTYTVNVGPCVNTNTTQLQVSQYNPAGFSGTVSHLCFNSNPVNLINIVQSPGNGAWLGDVIQSGTTNTFSAIQTNTFYPGQLPTGIYIATYHTASFPNPGLCTDSRTIAISVLNPPIPSITQVGPLCNSSAAFQLSVTPAVGYWTGSPYVSSTGIFTPSLSSVGSNAVQYVIGTNTCNVHDTKFVSVEAFVPASIVSQIPDMCNTSPVMNLGPLTLNGQGLWSGPGISGTNFNPASTGAGNFILLHKTSSYPSGLCPDEATVSVNVYSLAVPAIVPVARLCNNSLPFQLQVSPVGGLFGGPDVGIISLGGHFNPAAAIIGDNVVNYSITSGPCLAYAQTVVKVEKFISADLVSYPGPFCKTNDPVNLNSFAVNPNGYWTQLNGGKGLMGPYMFHPSQTIAGQINQILYTTHSVPTESLCPDSKTITIEVKGATPVKALSIKPLSECVPVQVVFYTPSANIGEGIWNFGDGSEPVSGLSEVTHIFTTPGIYNVQFNYTDEIGCKSDPASPGPVAAYAVPKADFSFPDEILISEPQIQLTNLTTILGDNKYEWKIPGSVASNKDVNPMVTFPKIGKYQVTLIATSSHECRDEITKSIEVKNAFNVFIPNSFTPNFDKLNDFFIPVFSKEGLDLKSFEMEIFDRWGHSLFRTNDASSEGWNGTVQNKGEALKEEVYVYRIKYKDMEGNSYNKMGHVSLVK